MIRVENLGKRYRLGEREPYGTLREALAAAASAPLRRVRSLAKRETESGSKGKKEFIWALRNVSFEVGEGEAVGIIGNNGSGKSTLLKILSRVTEPTEGRAEMRGRVGSLLEVGTGFHPELTGRENIYLSGAVLGMARTEISQKFDEIVAFSEVERFLETPVKRYSSGMYVRLAFAIAAHLEPEILLVDEVLSVGDISFQRKCLGKMETTAREGRTVLFVSHNMSLVMSLCGRALLLNKGRIELDGRAGDVVRHYEDSSFESAAVVDPDAGMWMNRRQAGEARSVIESVEMLDPATGKRKPYLRTGDSVTFRIHYRSAVDFDGAGFEFAIRAEGGSTPLIACRTDADLWHTPLRAGQAGHLDCTFPAFPLAANRADSYFISVLIYDPRASGPSSILFDGRSFGSLRVLPREVEGRRYPVTTGASFLAAEYQWS